MTSNADPLDPNRFSSLAAIGFRVFPVLTRQKKPAVTWTDFVGTPPTPEQLATWDASNMNVGAITGEPSSFVAIDVDSLEAQAFVDTFDFPITPYVVTAKGRHYLFRLPPGGLQNATNVGGHRLDVRGDGGFVVAPGSVHESGHVYRWGTSPNEAPFAELPAAFLALQLPLHVPLHVPSQEPWHVPSHWPESCPGSRCATT